MIGKLRQVSEFDLAKYKKNPAQMLRALAGAQQPSGGAGFAGAARNSATIAGR